MDNWTLGILWGKTGQTYPSISMHTSTTLCMFTRYVSFQCHFTCSNFLQLCVRLLASVGNVDKWGCFCDLVVWRGALFACRTARSFRSRGTGSQETPPAADGCSSRWPRQCSRGLRRASSSQVSPSYCCRDLETISVQFSIITAWRMLSSRIWRRRVGRARPRGVQPRCEPRDSEYLNSEMEATYSSEISVITRATRRRHIQQDCILHCCRCENVKSWQ
jgi:hypothetical protein